MKIFFSCIAIIIVFFSVCLLPSHAQTVITGGVSVDVPNTPAEVTIYLRKMELVMQKFDQLGASLVNVMSTGKASPAAASLARKEYIKLASIIDRIVPPEDLTTSHKMLANSLRTTSEFLYTMNNAQPGQQQQILFSLMPVINELRTSTTMYKNDVDGVIAYYHLSPTLNPIRTKESTPGGAMGLLSQLGGMVNSAPAQRQQQSPAANMGDLGALLGGMGGMSGGGQQISPEMIQQIQNMGFGF